MTKRADSAFLSDILHEAQVAVRACNGLSLEQFEENEILFRAIERCLEIIGEAATNLSQTAKETTPDIPWKLMSAMRNRISHGYWGSDAKVILDTVRADLPEVIRHLLAAGVKAVPARKKVPVK